MYSLEDTKFGKDSFKHISDPWYKDIKKYCREVPVVVFGNKVDLIDENNLDNSNVQKLVKDNNFLGYYITSAKTGQGVIEAFNDLINILYCRSKELSEL